MFIHGTLVQASSFLESALVTLSPKRVKPANQTFQEETGHMLSHTHVVLHTFSDTHVFHDEKRNEQGNQGYSDGFHFGMPSQVSSGMVYFNSK